MAKSRQKVEGGFDPEFTALAEELGRVAKRPTPLCQESFYECHAILNCSAVRARATAGDTGQRALAAVTAVRAAIDSISHDTERTIAQAMFAAVEKYEMPKINLRQELLTTETGITREVWYANREKILHSLAGALQVPGSTLHTAAAQPKGNDPLQGIALQAQRAALLHYAALTTLFVREFDHEVLGNANSLRLPSRAYFFNTYIALMYGPGFAEFTLPKGQLAIKQRYVEGLDRDALVRASYLGNVLNRNSPIGPTTYTNREVVQTLQFMTHFEAKLESDSHQLLTFNEMIAVRGDAQGETNSPPDSSPEGVDSPRLMDVYRDWCHWLVCEMNTESRGKAVERLAGASGALSTLLGAKVKGVAIHTVARSFAQKALSTYYDFPDWEPLANGYSLRQQADAFFDRVGPAMSEPYLRLHR